ncbi:MAG: DEAD/DEAH box helicase [Chitinophagaceae bacterium]
MSHIIKHIYNFATDEVIRRGKKIFLTDGVKLVKKDELSGQLHFRVKNDQYYNQYNVSISKYLDEHINARCQCPYNMGEICRHEAAALFYLNDLYINQKLEESNVHFNQMHTTVRMQNIDLKLLRLYSSNKQFEESQQLIKQHKVSINKAENEKVESTFTIANEQFQIILKRNDDKTFDTSCNCSESEHPLCKHKTGVFLQLLNAYGENYFDSIRNWNTQKNKLLGLYGYSMDDDLTGKFEFYYQNEKPFLKVLDKNIKKVNTTLQEKYTSHSSPAISKENYAKHIGLVINLNEQKFPNFSFEVIEGELGINESLFAGAITSLDTSKYIPLEKYTKEDREILSQVRKVQKPELEKFITKNSPFGSIWENIVPTQDEYNQHDTKKLILEYLHPKLLSLFNALHKNNPIYLLPKGKGFKIKELIPVQYLHHNLYPTFQVQKNKNGITIQTSFQFDDEKRTIEDNRIESSLLYLFENKLLLTHKAKDATVIAQLSREKEIATSEWQVFLQNQIIPYSTIYDFEFDKELVEHTKASPPLFSIALSEQGSFIIFKPLFEYEGHQIEYNDETHISIQQNEKLLYLERDKIAEESHIQWFQSLHEKLMKPSSENHFALHVKYAFASNWIFNFFDLIKEQKIPLYGYEGLKNFRVKKSKPTTNVHISSNIDWFDLDISLAFDNQKVDSNEIRKAILAKENYIRLDDGSLGLLPEEWIKKFSLLYKMSQVKGNKLSLSKFHFTAINEIEEYIQEQEIKDELEVKKQFLLSNSIEDVLDTEAPKGLKATLRPYQLKGFQWLSYLHQIQWGGLLADDMGLGKTIQALTFLLNYYEKNENLHALVVCPTTLLFNWENEILKFTPDLSYIIHHGSARTLQPKELSNFNIVLTTYGILRSDIDLLNKNEIDFIFLDESQTIKNPTSKIAKACQSITAKNKFALSGTPMQNNTFDLFSQMNFLNPGLLGSKEFFKEHFAKPIDKFQDVDSKEHLKKLVFPFLLRRTKEQVAKDLPDKTEIVLYCSMEEEQRKIYEHHRSLYYDRIMHTIDSVGINKSQFTILQGLMKLRQICDSPAILKDDTTYENHSIKLQELVREIEDNMGNHKALVFSQFIGMLSLIRKEFNDKGIKHQYFDGSYTAQQREQAINDFQKNDDCRVFLISLKAGGMGLNLTAADYVYIVDPWWNPAVEQQAIDRTHRIGQTKNIFAYRMICKDTVEEKIMLLKERKNALVKDIIAEDQHLIKQLSKDDINYLFS